MRVSRSPSAFPGRWEDRCKIALGIALTLVALLTLTAVLARAIIRPIEPRLGN